MLWSVSMLYSLIVRDQPPHSIYIHLHPHSWVDKLSLCVVGWMFIHRCIPLGPLLFHTYCTFLVLLLLGSAYPLGLLSLPILLSTVVTSLVFGLQRQELLTLCLGTFFQTRAVVREHGAAQAQYTRMWGCMDGNWWTCTHGSCSSVHGILLLTVVTSLVFGLQRQELLTLCLGTFFHSRKSVVTYFNVWNGLCVSRMLAMCTSFKPHNMISFFCKCQCGGGLGQLLIRASCLHFFLDFLWSFCTLWHRLSSICSCSLINRKLPGCWAILELLPFLEHLVQLVLWYMLWPQLLSWWCPMQFNLIYYHHTQMP